MKHNAIMKGDCQESHCLNGNANLEMHVCSQWVGILHKSNYVGVTVCLLGRNFYESLNIEDLWGGWLSVQWLLSPSLMASVQSPDPTDGKERTDSNMLSLDLHTCAMSYANSLPITYILKSNE